MQSQLRLVHVSNGWGGVLASMFGISPLWVVLFKQPFESLVANGLYHPEL